MDKEPVNTPIQTEYTEHLTAALAANQAEQATLTARLNKLRGEEKWLAAALADTPRAVGVEPPPGPAQPASSTPPVGKGTDAAAVPLPRMEKPADGAAPATKATTTKKASAKKTTAKRASETPAKQTAAVKKTPAKKTAAAGAKETTQAEPTLGNLLSEILSKQPGEPKKVSEIQSELEAAHPDRATSVQTIRNALQRLVEKDKLERDNRQGMVLYTWPVPEATPPPANPPKAEEPAPAPI
ncbi:hypothetical protein [Streptomyces subrutilus]|uniref:Regulatory protein n=1 Tax=Streptomyces subrutilus TaxID=36818 RepID=A0A1E5PLD1_9ACTN|nr:hypothetical protein [Streptomyces subrutilus]OEJ30152.1 hypothetical protein BGK67_01095 [Streptomyces subrutilus]